MKLFGMVCLSCLLLGTASLPAYTIRIPTKPAPGKTWVPLDRPLVPLEEQRGRGYRPDMVAPDFEKSKQTRPLRERASRIKPLVEKPLYEPSSNIKTVPERVKFDRPMFQRPVFDGKHAIWSQTPKTTPKQAGWLKPIFVK